MPLIRKRAVSPHNAHILSLVNPIVLIDNTVAASEGNLVYFLNSEKEISNHLVVSGANVLNLGADILLSNLANGAIAKQYIIKNKTLSLRKAQYHIGIGAEGSTPADNDVLDTIISENYVRGQNTATFVTGSATHGIFVGYQINADIKFNYAYGAAYGVISKGSLATVFTSKGIHHNIIRNCKQGILAKGTHGGTIAYNTIHCSYAAAYGVNLTENISAADKATNWIVKNNIICLLGAGTQYAIYTYSDTNVIDYNIYYSVNTLRWLHNGIVKTFAEWQALGFDTHSIVINSTQYAALFNDPANGDFTLKSGSVAQGFATELPLFATSLDASTNWGTDVQLPSVKTKTNTLLCAGAYSF